MSWPSIAYNVGMISLLLYAFWAGGSEERWAAAVVVAASAASSAVMLSSRQPFRNAEMGTFAVDVLAAAAFMTITMRSRSYWPIWASACALNGAIATPARLLVRDVPFMTYFATESIWAVGVMAAIGLGTAARSRPGMTLGRSTRTSPPSSAATRPA